VSGANVSRQAASEVARELLDEAVSRLRGGVHTTELSHRGTELRIEAARGYLRLARMERDG